MLNDVNGLLQVVGVVQEAISQNRGVKFFIKSSVTVVNANSVFLGTSRTVIPGLKEQCTPGFSTLLVLRTLGAPPEVSVLLELCLCMPVDVCSVMLIDSLYLKSSRPPF